MILLVFMLGVDMRVVATGAWVRQLVCVAGMLVSAVASASAVYSNVYFFGDSLSDTGNLYLATQGAIPASPPYDAGRFSNGPVWAEDFAQALGFSVTPSLLGGNDYAYAAATIGNFGRTVPSLPQQLGSYFQQTGNVARSDALYVILGGGNDLVEVAKDPATAAARIAGSAALVGDMADSLYAAGARNILVVNLPNVGRTPQVTAQGVAAAQAGTALSQVFDAALASRLDVVKAQSSGLALDLFDLYGFEQRVLANSAQYGFTNTTDACKSGSVAAPGAVCSDADSYYFWDAFHPTAHAHALIADAALQSLSPVPEPASYGLLALGLAALVMTRRRA